MNNQEIIKKIVKLNEEINRLCNEKTRLTGNILKLREKIYQAKKAEVLELALQLTGEEPQAEQKAEPVITKVICEYKTNHYQYIAVFTDGSEKVIRKRSTRFYPMAFMYDQRIREVSKEPLSDFFTFGKAPSREANVKRTFKVEKV